MNGHPALRLPRRTVRLRLTLLYGGLFLISGTALLVITYVLVAHRFPAFVTAQSAGPTSGPTASAGGGSASISIGGIGAACAPRQAVISPAQFSRCATLAQADVAKQQADEMNELLTQSGVALAIMTVISIGLGWLVAGRVLAPLRTITTAARRVSATSLNQRLALDGPDDELKELGDTFDGLLARLEASFDAQRQFVANASHELRTPLARQRTVVEVALADPQPSVASLRHACERVLAAGEQQERLIEALLTLARSQRGLDRCEPVDLAEVAGGVLGSRQAEATRRGLTVSASLAPAPVIGDTRLAERLAANLVDNALRHNVPGGRIKVSTGRRAGQAFLSVANTGPVIAPAELASLFEPFQRRGTDRTGAVWTAPDRTAPDRTAPDRTGADGLGLGLGLSIVRAIAAAHHARLRARALPNGGLDISIRLPLGPAVPAPTAPPPLLVPA
ncbi:MAG: ATP-binding protein [Streptosporangiaceae bacterium]